ncbi:DUF4294 domain-containing protein [Tenacibaculum sp. UWU-22]|uniref:DUF4294 domain-containing protein n=1 Tax=Tenacibaculum sp. UWU-22 TaxID=3234187 RepID=UPI0034DAFF59
MKKLLYIYVFMQVVLASAQIKDTLPDFDNEYMLMKEGDSIMIKLNEVTLFPKHKFKSSKDAIYYYWFRKKVFKAYPYATLAAERIDTVKARVDKIKSKSKKRKYIRIVQEYLENQLADQLKKMTRTEGRILIKLIHRQTGKTAYDNIKELRSGWKAFWYNTTANLFELSLKTTYNPLEVNEDFLIEDILQRAFIDDSLAPQPSKLQFDYKEIVANHNNAIDVEKYKKMFAKKKKKKDKKVKDQQK